MRPFARLRTSAQASFVSLVLLATVSAASAAGTAFTLAGDPGVAGVGEAIGDTLTVIMKPLLNMPALAQPGSGFTISCSAPSTTTGWAAELVRGATHVPLTVTGAVYEASTLWWRMTATVPAGILSELYDLRVTANGGISDVTKHAVKVLPAYRTSYYFIHITDTHLPTNLYYTASGAATDSNSTIDLREVINDVNIINPEFVLLTGDLINEGELEDYLTFREYTRAQRLLGEFLVPVNLTSGNHDLGGWDATPPSDGTARRDWWRFFGWKRLGSPPAGAPARTQDYSFDYGPVHFVGLEGYLNYDNWLPAIYGTESFTSAQLSWLSADLAAAAGSTSQVLFFHSDFGDQLNLSTLGVEMALSGHIHSDSGSLTTRPFDLTTANTDNGKRTYRLIRVNSGVVTPYATLSAGSTGQNLRATFAPSNNGTANTVTATVVNNQALRFENALLRFVMPHGPANYVVTGGTRLQTEDTATATVVSVQVDLLAGSTQTVTVAVDLTGVGDVPGALRLAQNTPNPFNPRTTLSFDLPAAGPVRLAVYDVAGRLVRTLVAGALPAGSHEAVWDGRDATGRAMASGSYLARLEAGRAVRTVRMGLVR